MKPKHAIAVLPFINMSANPEQEFFSDGITEEIINALARIEPLKVISRTSSFHFKGKNPTITEVVEQLGVQSVLQGSVRMAHGLVRITAQLIQAEDDAYYWSETWDRKLENIFEIQDEISLQIAEKLREQFGHFEISEQLVAHPTENVDAYTCWMKGRHLFNKWNPADVKASIPLFEEAVALDPALASAYVGLADAYSFLGTTELMPREEAWGNSVKYTHKAYEVDPNHAGVHYLMANLAFFTDCNFAEAFRHTQRALELMPGYPEAQQYMSFLYALRGELQLAHHHLQLAQAIDPLSQETLFYRGYYHYRAGDYAQALEHLETCLQTNPMNIPAYITKSYVLIMLGRVQECLDWAEAMPEEIVMPDEQLGLRCLAQSIAGMPEAADSFVKLQASAENPYAFQAHSYVYLVQMNTGAYDAAFDWLEQCLKLKSSVFMLSFSDPMVTRFVGKKPRYLDFHAKIYGSKVEAKPAKEKGPLLEREVAQDYLKKLEDYVVAESPHLNPSLTLRMLAGLIEIHPNQLSWLLNEHLGVNFNEYVNRLRLEQFKVLAGDPKNHHISLIGLAYESGFNSKTVFNTFFKKETGMTPSQYLKSLS